MAFSFFFFLSERKETEEKRKFQKYKINIRQYVFDFSNDPGLYYIYSSIPWVFSESNEKYHQRIFEELKIRDKKIFDPPLSEGDINLVNFIIEYNRTHINLKIILVFDSLEKQTFKLIDSISILCFYRMKLLYIALKLC